MASTLALKHSVNGSETMSTGSEKCLQEVKQCLPEVKQCLQDVKHSLSEVKQCLPEVKPYLQDVKHSLSEVKQCLPEVKQSLPEVDLTEAEPVVVGPGENCEGSVLTDRPVERSRHDLPQLLGVPDRVVISCLYNSTQSVTMGTPQISPD